MSQNVISCSPETDIEDAIQTMAREQLRRLPICNDEGIVVGILAIADLAQRTADKQRIASILERICTPGGPHCQGSPAALPVGEDQSR
jgi:CBS domain-containing protein